MVGKSNRMQTACRSCADALDEAELIAEECATPSQVCVAGSLALLALPRPILGGRLPSSARASHAGRSLWEGEAVIALVEGRAKEIVALKAELAAAKLACSRTLAVRLEHFLFAPFELRCLILHANGIISASCRAQSQSAEP